MPIISSTTTIMQAVPFHFREIRTNQVCDMYYTGPECVLYNISANCIQPLNKDDIINDAIIGKGCKKAKSFQKMNYYESRNCRKLSNITMTSMMVKNFVLTARNTTFTSMV